MPRAMAAAAWCVLLLALGSPRAEANLVSYEYDPANVTGYVVGSELITNAQCKEVRACLVTCVVSTVPGTRAVSRVCGFHTRA